MRAAYFLFLFLWAITAQGALSPQCAHLLQTTLQKKICPSHLPLSCKTLDKLVYWQCNQLPKSSANFEQLMAFVVDHPHLPRIALIQQRAEEKLCFNTSASLVLKWFQKMPPLTARGHFFLARAHLQTGHQQEAIRIIKNTWQHSYFTQAFQKDFFKQFQTHISYADHLERIESLAWERQHKALQNMKPYIKREARKLIDALIALIRNQSGLDKKVKALPETFHNHPVFLYHRIQWRLKHRKLKDVLSLFQQVQRAQADRRHPEAWYPLKYKLMRHYIDQENFNAAYNVIAAHHITQGINGVFAEWHAGWIALRKLKHPQKALPHLKAFYNRAKTPISKSKGAFYIAQAYQELNISHKTLSWLEKGAQYPLTFYGQKALEALNRDIKHQVQPHNNTYMPQNKALQDMSMILPLLSQAGLTKLSKVFVIHGARFFTEEDNRAHFVYLVRQHAPQYAVLAAKIAGRNGTLALTEAYPVLEKHLIPEVYHEALPLPVIHAVIRQESGFNHHDISPAGAHGLMQLMPKTAKYLAKKAKISYASPRDLLRHPHLNVSLGVNYLHGLLHRYEGNLVLSLAGYNAGETRVKRWIERYGDPRHPSVDILDWIESIPFEETQSYIYRILESIPIYEFLHPDHPHALPLAMPALKMPEPKHHTKKMYRKKPTAPHKLKKRKKKLPKKVIKPALQKKKPTPKKVIKKLNKKKKHNKSA